MCTCTLNTIATHCDDWFSGELHCSKGEFATYVHLGYASQYEQKLLVDIHKGLVVGERIEVNGSEVTE